MAEYKHGNLLTQSYDSKYDDEHSPGIEALYAGIYRCVACGDEVGIAKGNKLPPQNHPQHTSSSKIKWKLLVRAIQQ